MGCETNAFCSSLPKNLRKQFCSDCKRSLLSIKSMENYIDSDNFAFILLDGLIVGRGFGDTQLDAWPNYYLSRTIIITPGYLANFKGFIKSDREAMTVNSYLICESDCCIARFDYEFVTEMVKTYPLVQELVAKNLFDWAVASSEFLSIVLISSLKSKVKAFLAYLERYKIYFTEAQIATLLGCSRNSVVRAFSEISKDSQNLFRAYISNKKRSVILQHPSQA